MLGHSYFVLLALTSVASGFSEVDSYGNTKIVGGREVNITDAPFVVSLLFKDRPLCGGSIISNKFIITAAHCTYNKRPKDLTIRSGSSGVKEGNVYRISHIYNHPEYTSINFDYDVSLIKIFGNIRYDESRRAVKLPEENDEITEGDIVRALGWGRTLNPKESSKNLRGVDLMIINHEECESAYKVYDIKIEHNKVCAIHPERIDGRDSCQGDSGGPLQRMKDGKLIGIVSFGLDCGKADYAGIYARVCSIANYKRSLDN